MQKVRKRLVVYGKLALRALDMLRGKSYYHLDQKLGPQFVPGQLAGYYNDLSGKADWLGDLRDDGIPLNRDPDGNPVIIPTTVFQKSIGHWEMWLASGKQDDNHRREFLKIMDWALQTQDERGGWEVYFLKTPAHNSVYSSMTQGEAASTLVRAYHITNNDTYLTAARRALGLMLCPVEQGGTARMEGNLLILEEFPKHLPNTVFNGWIFSLYGLYDFLLVQHDDQFAQALAQTLTALVAYLPHIDAGYWSYYDTNRTIASPFYQKLHIAQFRALALTFPDHAGAFDASWQQMERQMNSRFNTERAVVAKTWQKILRPPAFVNR